VKRVAILLGSPLPEYHESHLRGVKRDVKNYKQFLLSSTGGAWYENEIHTGWDISEDVVPKIQSLCADADIAVIIYSGHGFMSQGKSYLNINEYENICADDLTTSAKRQITIVDACRNYNWTESPGIYGIFDIVFDYDNLQVSRALYDYHINQSAYGHISLYSSSPNQSSEEDSRRGGKYTLALLTGASSWGSLNTQIVFPIQDAFKKSVLQIQDLDTPQVPQCAISNSNALLLPFAINPKVYLRKHGHITNQRMIQPVPQKSNAGPVLLISALVLGLVISSKKRRK
jgi:hypothetical protein